MRIDVTPCSGTNALAMHARPVVGNAVALTIGAVTVRLDVADLRRLATLADPPCPCCGNAMSLDDEGEPFCIDCPIGLPIAVTAAA